eukprot:11218753-Lingulodinium_polyedra.AAC.1
MKAAHSPGGRKASMRTPPASDGNWIRFATTGLNCASGARRGRANVPAAAARAALRPPPGLPRLATAL